MNISESIKRIQTQVSDLDPEFVQSYQARIEKDLDTPRADLLQSPPPSHIVFPDNTRVDLPLADNSPIVSIAKVTSSLTDAQKQEVESATKNLVAAIEQEYERNPEAAKAGTVSASLNETYRIESGRIMENLGSVAQEGFDSQIGATMASAIAELDGDLYAVAKGIETRTQLNSEMRLDAHEIRDAVSNWPDGQDTQVFSWTEVRVDKDGNTLIEENKDVALTKTEAEGVVEELDALRAALGDILQMDRLLLQDQFQQNQQLHSILSAILKDNHTTRQNISSNIRSA